MKKILLSILIFTYSYVSLAQTYAISAILNGANALPGNNSTGNGNLNGTLNAATGAFSYSLGYYFPISSGNNYHFCLSDGSCIISNPISASPIIHTLNLSSYQVSELLSGNLYIQIESSAFPSGEIRGHIKTVEIFEESNKSVFYDIKKYQFRDFNIPNGPQADPFVRKGPTPQNDFVYIAKAQGGILNPINAISNNIGTEPITLDIKTPNVKIFGADVFASNVAGAKRAGSVEISVITSSGNQYNLIRDSLNSFAGFRLNNADEFITNIFLSHTASSTLHLSIYDLVLAEEFDHDIALHFENDFVSIPNTLGNFSGSQNFTIETWIKADMQTRTDIPYNDIIDKFLGPQAHPFPYRFQYMNHTAGADYGKIRVSRSNGTQTTTLISSSTVLLDQNWHHVVFSKSGTALFLIIDGNVDINVNNDTLTTTANQSAVYLGGGAESGNFFKGAINELRIWNVFRSIEEIQQNMYCKVDNTLGLIGAFHFDQGDPQSDNFGISKAINSVNEGENATLSGFNLIGSNSNFVNGLVRYVNVETAHEGSNGSSWANAYASLESALAGVDSCNSMLEVWVAKGKYRLLSQISTYNIAPGMKVYGGFAGTETHLMHRNLKMAHTINKTTLSGDVGNNDITSDFNSNRSENAKTVVKFTNPLFLSYATSILDGFTVSGGHSTTTFNAGGLITIGTNPVISNCIISDNFGTGTGGLALFNSFGQVKNCSFLGNKGGQVSALFIWGDLTNYTSVISNSLFSGNSGINTIYNRANSSGKSSNPAFVNCTIASNAGYGFYEDGYITNPYFVNTVIYGNSTAGLAHGSNAGSPTVNASLIQDDAYPGLGNLDGSSINPQFVDPIVHTLAPTLLGDYNLKWCSMLIDTLSSPITMFTKDLNNTYRDIGTVDIGAFEYKGNRPNSNVIDFGNGVFDIPEVTGRGLEHIISANKILAPASSIDFTAPKSITLNPGFEARGMEHYFQAKVQPNESCVN